MRYYLIKVEQPERKYNILFREHWVKVHMEKCAFSRFKIIPKHDDMIMTPKSS